MVSQCCSCGHTFQITSEEVLFCSVECEKKHDLFSVGKQKNSLESTVTIYYLTPEELDKYRSLSKNRVLQRKPHRVIDWRWPQNRRKND